MSVYYARMGGGGGQHENRKIDQIVGSSARSQRPIRLVGASDAFFPEDRGQLVIARLPRRRMGATKNRPRKGRFEASQAGRAAQTLGRAQRVVEGRDDPVGVARRDHEIDRPSRRLMRKSVRSTRTALDTSPTPRAHLRI